MPVEQPEIRSHPKSARGAQNDRAFTKREVSGYVGKCDRPARPCRRNRRKLGKREHHDAGEDLRSVARERAVRTGDEVDPARAAGCAKSPA